MEIKLALRRTWDDGGAAYEADGIRGTIYVKKGYFTGDASKTLTLVGEGLATPATAEETAAAEATAKTAADEKKAEAQGKRDAKKAARTSAQGDVTTTSVAANS